MFLLVFLQLSVFFKDSIFVFNPPKITIFVTVVDTNITSKDIFITLNKKNILNENSIVFRKLSKNSLYKWCTLNAAEKSIPLFNSYKLFDKDYILIRSDTGSGLVSLKGKIASKFHYATIKSENGILLAKRENSIILTQSSGKYISQISAVDKLYGVSNSVFITMNGSKYGVYDYAKASYILHPVYDSISFHKNNFIVKIGNKFGMYNKNGTLLLPIIYDDLLPDTLHYFKTCLRNVDAHDQLSSLKFVDEKWGIVDSNGTLVIPNEYAEIGKYAFDSFAVKNTDFFEFVSIKSNFKNTIKYRNILPKYPFYAPIQVGFYWGVINHLFQWTIMPSFSEILPISDSVWILKKSKNMSFYLPYSNQVVSPSYEEIITTNAGYFKIINNGLLGLLSPQLKQVIPAIYTKIKVFEKEKIIVTNKLNYYSIFYMNGNLKVRMHYTFDQYLDYVDGFARVQHKGKWGFVNTDGQIVVSTQYDECKDFVNGKAEVRIGNKWGYVSATEKLIVSPYYDETSGFSTGSGCVRKGNLWGFVSAVGKEIVKPQFESILLSSSNKYIVSSNGKSGIFDENGIELMSLFYKDCIELKPDFYKTRLFGKYGLVDAKNTKIVDFLYDDITWDKTLDCFLLYKNGDWQALK